MFTPDPGQLRTLLETLIGERGHAGMETVAYGFLALGPEDKISLQLGGADPDLIDRAQSSLRSVLRTVQSDRREYVARFQREAAAGTLLLLRRSREELAREREKYLELDGQPPDLDGLRAAARALAAQRRTADAAAATATEAFEKMRTQRQAPAHPGSFVPAPIMPYFPDPALRETAGRTNQEWWRQEQAYGRLRTASEARFPVLAMYADNQDGDAAGRLADLPTWGFFADSRMKTKILLELDQRIRNILTTADDLDGDPDRVWALPRIVQQTLLGTAATPFQQRWVNDEVARQRAAAAERARLIATVTLALAVAAVALTAGAALAPAGTAGAAALAGLATGAQAGTTGLTIAYAYQELRDYAFEEAAQATSLDRAESISSDDPSFFWLALTLASVILDVAALRAAFTASRGMIQAARAGRDATTLADELATVPQVSRDTAEAIAGRVTAELGSLPPPSPQAAAAALERLSTWDTLVAAERQAVVVDALAAGDPAVILARTGRNARELVRELGKGSVAARSLQSALTRKAYAEVGPALRSLGPDTVLDDAAVYRIVARNDVQQIKGQLLEEVMAVEIRRTLAGPADDAARQALLRGAEGEGAAQFIAGPRITDTGGRQLTDGMLAVLRGDDELVVIRAFEAKAGLPARAGLSRTGATKLADLPSDEQTELLHYAADLLRDRRADLRSLSTEFILRDHEQAVMEIVSREIRTGEWGQAVRTSERLGADVDAAGRTMPAEILVDGVRRKVIFPEQQGRPQITGVLPRDLRQGRPAEKVSRKQGVSFDMQNVTGIDQARLNQLAQDVAAAKGLPVR